MNLRRTWLGVGSLMVISISVGACSGAGNEGEDQQETCLPGESCWKDEPTCPDELTCSGGTVCLAGQCLVVPASGNCMQGGQPEEERCDGLDNDCDGTVDETCGCSGDEVRDCYRGPGGTAGVGVCRAGSMRCDGEFWGACEGDVLPGEEGCNGLDDDCDGEVDEGLGAPETCDGRDNDCDGDTDEGLAEACTGCDGQVTGWRTCQAGRWSTCPEPVEICNALDDDCDGLTDEDLECETNQDECTDDTMCPGDELCTTYPDGFTGCANPTPCDPEADRPCSWGQQCIPGTDDTWFCYDPPRISCWAHIWHDADGGHWDTCMNCNYEPGTENGSFCEETTDDADLLLTCENILHTAGRTHDGNFDFLAASFPVHNPSHYRRCLVAWGMHPMETGTDLPYAIGKVRILGGAAQRQSLERAGFRTSLPAAAFQHVHIESPPGTSVPVPRVKEERGVRVFWDESSVADKRDADLHIPYEACKECRTFGDLIDHMYPGPEVFCQGLPRDPADSQFVVPLWLPCYDDLYGVRTFVLTAEIICEQPDGVQAHAVTVATFPAK